MTTTETVKSSCQEKIISLLPAATEIIAALDSACRLAGRSHECDWPSDVLHARVLTSSNIDASGTSHQIDQQVKNAGSVGLFEIDKDAIKSLKPYFIFTQDTCQVCAVDTHEVEKITNSITLPNGSKP